MDGSPPQKIDRFELIGDRPVGRGSFGEVWEARDPMQPHRQIAIKILKQEFSTSPDSPQIFERFFREADITKKLDLPGLVKSLDFGQDGDRYFIAMDFVQGKTLEMEIKQKIQISWENAIKIIEYLAETLDKIHAAGVIHRDLKPSNIIINAQGLPVITDLGSAFFELLPSITLTGQIPTTPSYTPPELWLQATYHRDLKATAATDVYALGCILYEMLLGQKLFPSEMNTAYNAHVTMGAQLPDQWPESVPRGFRIVLGFAVNRDQANRYQSVGKFAQALRGLQQGQIIPPRFNAPGPLPIRQHIWSTYACFKPINRLAVQGNLLWGATSGGVFCYDLLQRRIKHRITTSDGLPESEISSIAVDEITNRVNITTQRGWNLTFDPRFNSLLLTSIPELLGKRVNHTVFSKDGNLWMATNDGVLRLSPDGTTASYNELENRQTFIANCLLIGPDLKIWAGTSTGIIRLNNGIWERLANDISSGISISMLVTDGKDIVWAGTKSRGLIRYNRGNWDRFTTSEGLPGNEILDLELDDRDNLWVCTSTGLTRITRSQLETISIRTNHNQKLPRINSITSEPATGGGLWLGTREGLYSFDGQLAYPVVMEQELLEPSTHSILKDHRENIWVGSDNGISFGYTKDGKRNWLSYSHDKGFLGPIKVITEYPRDIIWVGTGRGLYQLNLQEMKEWKQFHAGPECLPGEQVNAMMALPGSQELWVATNSGIGVWNWNNWKQIRRQNGLQNENVSSLWPDPMGGIWCGTRGGGAFYWNNDNWRPIGSNEGLRGSDILGISSRSQDNSLWIVTNQGVFCRTTDIYFRQVILPKQAGNYVRCVFADRKGYIWLGTNNGVICYSDDRTSSHFTVQDGLAGNQVNFITQDSQDILWFCTNQGVSSLD